MSNKKSNNSTCNRSYGENNWTETKQMSSSGSPMSNQAHQPRKNNRFQNVKNQSPKFYANKSYNNNKPNEDHQADSSSNAMVPDIRKNNIYSQCLSVDQSLNEFNAENNVLPPNGHENNLLSDSMASCSPTSSSNSSYNDNIKINNADNDDRLVTNMHDHNQVVYDQQLGIQNQFMQCNVPQMSYECDYQQQQQQASQYYIYHPYQEYGQGLSGSPLNNSFTGTPQPQQQQQQQQSTTFYTAYQTIPSYIYDPTVGAYTTQAAAYSPMMSQQSPNTPQQQTSMLASYKTPTQPVHQLYMANITPPSSLSPNDTCANSSTNDRTSNCNSPHPNGGVVPNTVQTPLSINPYVMYAGANPYLTPQAYQCNSPVPTPQYMMYHPPPPLPPQQQQQQQQMNSPVMQTPQYNSSLPKYNKSRVANKYNNGQNKRGHNSNPRYNSCFEQTPQSSYNLDESMYSPVGAYTEADESQQTFMSEQGMPVYPTSPYCDPNAMMGMPNSEAILNAGYNYDALNGIESYGDDYGDAYDENGNGEDNDENLACQVCRGRRMCFCYFLKVRYYKFPSFFDLVDHQYKKWRATMAKQNQAMLNSNNNSPNMMMSNNNQTAMPLGNITNHNNAKKA